MFKVNDYLEEAISNQNVVRIRNEFSVIAHEDPTFSTGKFNDTLAYVKSKNINGFIVPFDGRDFAPCERWDEEYWALIVSSLLDNFCEQRIEHLKEVSKKLFAKRETINFNNAHINFNSSYESANRCNTSKKLVPTAITMGLAATCLVAIAVGAKGLAVITGATALVTGIYTVKKK